MLDAEGKMREVAVFGPGIAPHTFSLTAARVNGTLKLGRPGRLVGVVRTESGPPIGERDTSRG